MPLIELNGNQLDIATLVKVARQQAKVAIASESYQRIEKSRSYIEEQVKAKKIIYGVTTGFGANASKVIDDYEEAKELQKNLLISHASGVGEYFSKEIVRAIMLIRLNTLLAGFSGVRKETVDFLCMLLNENIHPRIPSQGSVGASGDLCPLAHMALAVIGEGEIEFDEHIFEAKDIFQQKNITPIALSHKEGIALLNGTSVMAALGALAIWQAKDLLQKSLNASCLMFEAIGARKQAFDERIHQVRKHNPQIQIATWIREFTQNSTLIGIESNEILTKTETPQESNEKKAKWLSLENIRNFALKKVTPQDSYSIRCTPQVLGASLQAIEHCEQIIANELNAVVDNPLIFVEDNEVLSGGNFHGQPLALALDYLKLAIAEMGNLMERQINKLTDEATNDCLPAFLAPDTSGLHSGLMIPQYVAASLVSENKVLVHPASADSIPTCANQEDHVSMGTIAGRQALQILENVKKVTAILMLTANQAVYLRKQQLAQISFEVKLGTKTQILHQKLDRLIGFMDKDRFLQKDIEKILANWNNF
ncbi:MAG: aromatic amino acid ammonia-lyase [Thermonemataceae bacterium]|nr:aromatic amino acid ammonia-lyase [Thermonemataceae bacterium]